MGAGHPPLIFIFLLDADVSLSVVSLCIFFHQQHVQLEHLTGSFCLIYTPLLERAMVRNR